jgi:RHS repeat-associated protein
MIVTLVSSDQFFVSRRLAVMDQLGSVGTYYPWGENRGGTNPQDTWSFGTYWTDSVTGLDYANNRYYFNSLGRFVTPDPYASNSGGAGDPSGPQSWNKYAYTRGDPVNRVDPAGMQDCAADFCVTGYGLGDSEFGGSPGVGGSGGIIEPWNDPVGQKTALPFASSLPMITNVNSGRQKMFQKAAKTADQLLKNSQCDSLFGKSGLQLQTLLDDAKYIYGSTAANGQPISPGDVAVTLVLGNTVTINSGAISNFFATTDANGNSLSGVVLDGVFLSMNSWRAFVLLHELGHMVGFGTLWDSSNAIEQLLTDCFGAK